MMTPEGITTRPTTAQRTARYLVKYLIVNALGDLVYQGTAELTSTRMNLSTPVDEALAHLVTATSLREGCDKQGAPAGRVLIALLRELI